MPNIPDVSTLVHAARNIVFAARRKNQLSSLTVKSVRDQVERDYSLDVGALGAGEFKIAMRDAVKAAVSEELPVATLSEKDKKPQEDAEEAGKALSKSHKIQRKTSDIKGKGKRKATNEEEENGSTGPKSKKFRAAKSKEIIESDSEHIGDIPAPIKASSSSTKKKAEVKVSSSSIDVLPVDGEKSESELSVLIDEPPKKKRAKKKGNGEDGGKKPTKLKQQKEPAKPIDKDEETIKRLKSFVSACGVRKVWLKEFADLPLPKQQISRLKDMLAELGMTGRYSMDQAKAIKKKRDLARELNDVLEFERKAGASRATRNRQETKAKRTVGELDTDSEVHDNSEDEEEDDSPAAKGKKNTASRSIMAYLANQSSDED